MQIYVYRFITVIKYMGVSMNIVNAFPKVERVIAQRQRFREET